MVNKIFSKTISAIHYNKKSFLTFLLAGVGTTSIYFSLFSLFWYVLHLNHIIAVSVAFICAATFQFFTNRRVTFKVKNQNLSPQLVKYFALIIINYLLTVCIVQICMSILDAPFLGLILASGTTTITGYLLFRYWIFGDAIPILTLEKS